jgi:hypothetical protein
VVEALFNAFATTAFFKFMIFSVFEMRYLLLIWKARRPQGFQVLSIHPKILIEAPAVNPWMLRHLAPRDNREIDGITQPNPRA